MELTINEGIEALTMNSIETILKGRKEYKEVFNKEMPQEFTDLSKSAAELKALRWDDNTIYRNDGAFILPTLDRIAFNQELIEGLQNDDNDQFTVDGEELTQKYPFIDYTEK